MIKITGTKMNNLTLIIDGVKVGILDADHNRIYLDFTEEEWHIKYNLDIAFEVANFYDEIDIINDEAVSTVNYDVVYEEEEKKTMENMKKLEELKEEIKSSLSGDSLDFVNCYPLNSYGYISDAINEFADSHTSIYYNDQRNFYYNNTELCENALIDYGYSLDEMLKEGNTLDDLIGRAGAVGEYRHIEETINNELEDVIKLIIINYILDNKVDCDIEFLDDIDVYKLDRFDDLAGLVQENTKEEVEED